MWKSRVTSADLLRDEDVKQPKDLLYCIPALFEQFEQKCSKDGLDDLCSGLKKKLDNEPEQRLVFYQSLRKGMQTPKHQCSFSVQDESQVQVFEILKAVIMSRSIVSNRMEATSQASRNTNDQARLRQTHGKSVRLGRRRETSRRSRPPSSLVEREVGPSVIIKIKEILSKRLNTKKMEHIMKAFFFILSKQETHSIFTEDETRQLFSWGELYRDEDEGFLNKRLFLNQVILLLSKKLKSDTAVYVMVLEELCTFIIRNSYNFDKNARILSRIIFYESGHEKNDSQWITYEPEDQSLMGSILSFIVFNVNTIFPNEESPQSLAPYQLLPPPIFRQRRMEVFNGDPSTEEEKNAFFISKNEFDSFLNKAGQKMFLSMTSRLFRLYEFKFIVISVLLKYRTCPDEWQKKVKVLLPIQVTSELFDHPEIGKMKKGWEKDLRMRPETTSSNFLTINRKVEAENAIIDDVVDFHEKVIALRDRFIPLVSKQGILQAKFKLKQYQMETLFGGNFKMMAAASERFIVAFEVVNLVRAHHLTNVSLDFNASLGSIPKSITSSSSVSPDVDDEERHMGILCDVLLESVEDLFRSFLPYIRSSSAIQTFLAPFLPKKELMRTDGTENVRRIQHNEGRRLVSRNLDGNNPVNDFATLRKKRNDSVGKKTNKRTGTERGSTFRLGGQKFDIWGFFHEKKDDIPCLRNEELELLLKKPLDFFQKVWENVNRLLSRINQGTSLYRKLKLVREKFDECVKNLKAEQRGFDAAQSAAGSAISPRALGLGFPFLKVDFNA